MSNRRRYFRIDDYLLLDVKRVESSKRVELLEKFRRIDPRDNYHRVFHDVAGEVDGLIAALGQQQPEVARVLRLLNRKIDLMESSIQERIPGDTLQSMQQVNLSASGMRFGCNEEFRVGDLLQIQMVFNPDYITLNLLADVVLVETPQVGADYQQRVRVDFDFPRQHDQEQLIHYIMKRQGEAMMREREQQSD